MSTLTLFYILCLSIHSITGAPGVVDNEVANSEREIEENSDKVQVNLSPLVTVVKNFRATLSNTFSNSTEFIETIKTNLKQAFHQINQKGIFPKQLKSMEEGVLNFVENAKNISNGEVSSKMDKFLNRLETKLKIAESQLDWFIGDVNVNLNKITTAFDDFTNGLHNILDAFMLGVRKIFTNDKEEN
ncbi:hypothetical protein RI129_001052 [Pyrocoelia pectoralis]|uniref:Uncharacterized protein n=1 Tax=Pyrocoelia pectoralis TaxID=417401 RepID=A0AAN7VVP8_9COLE